MNLAAMMNQRAAAGNPITVGLIGAGKFGSMFLAQIPRLPGMHLVGIADLSPAAVAANLTRVGWPEDRHGAASLDDALAKKTTHISDDWQTLVAHPAIEVIVECTGNPIAAVEHCLEAFRQGKKVVNVTVEAEAFVGPLLSQRAAEAGAVYSMAYGDQPALVCDLVDWARACGFPVTAAGRGHKWLPEFRESTPETVWNHWGLSAQQAARGGLNPKMFNAFLDGSKPAIESSAIANCTGLDVPEDGLSFPSGSVADIPNLMRPKDEGGRLDHKGMVEVISCLDDEGNMIPYEIRNGVWVTVEADTDYIRNCFEEYHVKTDDSGRYMTLYKRWHLIGLELGVSVASVALRNEPTGAATCFNADVSATAKRALTKGEILDGEGGATVFGKLLPAKKSVTAGNLPLGLAHNLPLKRDVAKDAVLTWEDVEIDETVKAYQLRREMERLNPF